MTGQRRGQSTTTRESAQPPIARDRYDAVVVGVGGMGSAAAAHLADRGLSVLGLEGRNVPHAQGSSHGHSRVVSRSFYDRPEYMSLYDRAIELWRELEIETGEAIFHQRGSLTTGRPGTDVIASARRNCDRFDVAHEQLAPEVVADRFPGYRIPDDHVALFQPDDGFLAPERGVVAHVAAAHDRGAEIHARSNLLDWEARDDGVTIYTDERTVDADWLVVTAGAWTPNVLPGLADVLEPERQVLGRFQPTDPEDFAPDAFPVSAITTANGQYSAFPITGVPGVKVARVHHREQVVDPDAMARTVDAEDEAILRWFADHYLAAANGPTMRLQTCLYTNTPDGRFILDTLPDQERVAVAAGFSGHGYKFCPVVGEILADVVVGGETEFDVGPFRADRFD